MQKHSKLGGTTAESSSQSRRYFFLEFLRQIGWYHDILSSLLEGRFFMPQNKTIICGRSFVMSVSLAILILYIVALFAISWFAKKRSEGTTENYALAGRK